MTDAFAIAALWLGLAVVATVIAYYLRISIALVEICMGMAAGAACEYIFGSGLIGADADWLRFLASSGAVLLTFLAGAELEPEVMRAKWKEVGIIGIVGFFAPFMGCAALARYLLGWSDQTSLLAGVSLSTTSMAVVYAVMLETGFNRTEFGKGILGACFVNDLGTVIALGLLFAPFTFRTIVFVSAAVLALAFLPRLSKRFTRKFGHRTAAIRAKWIMFTLFGLGALALWSGSEAVLPAYVAGIVLAEFAARDELWIRRMRTLGIVSRAQYSFLVATVIASAVIPTMIASIAFIPYSLLPGVPEPTAEEVEEGPGNE